MAAKLIQAIQLTNVTVKCKVHASAVQIANVNAKSAKKQYPNYKKIKFDFVNKNPTPSIGITDYSNGATFKGWIKDLIVYR